MTFTTLDSSRWVEGSKVDYPNVISVSWSLEDWWLEIEHDGNLTWDTMQQIKNDWFGSHVECFEKYPPQGQVVNNGNYRHLWRWPDMAAMC